MPLVVVVHGGFWRPAVDRRHLRHAGAALRRAGWSVVAPEYRRIPGEPDAAVDDIRRALAAVDVPDAGVVLAGHSAGGQLALWAAAVCPPPGLRGTLALAPVADLAAAEAAHLGDGAVRAFLGGPADGRPDLDPARLPTSARPVTLLQGTEDADVPPANAASYAARHPDARARTVPDAGHYDLIDPQSPIWSTVLDELARF